MSHDFRTPIYDQKSRKEIARIGHGKIFDLEGNEIAATVDGGERFVFDDRKARIGKLVGYAGGDGKRKIVIPIEYTPPMPEAFRKLLPAEVRSAARHAPSPTPSATESSRRSNGRLRASMGVSG